VPVTVIVLSQDEALTIRRALDSTSWAAQRIVVDSGSSDGTPEIAAAAGATVVHQQWLGYAEQRELGMHLPQVQHEWVYFVDADEWVSADLAAEIAATVEAATCVAYRQRRRFIFQETWIRHCGWYEGSWIVRLLDRRHATFTGGASYGERALVDGRVGVLTNDLVDEDIKGLARWLTKHAVYAQLEAAQRAALPDLRIRIREAWRFRTDRPLLRALAKDVVWPYVPYKPLVLFLYMYVLRAGVRDGRAGLQFCVLRGWWFEYAIQAMAREQALVRSSRHSAKGRLSCSP